MMISMIAESTQPIDLQPVRSAFGDRVQLAASLSRFSAARVGGPADALLEVRSSDELVQACGILWQTGLPFTILGGGSNVLISDRGVRSVVVLNKARRVRFGVDEQGRKIPERRVPPQETLVWAESGVNFGALARQAAQRGLAGLEWAAGIPGTVGGAVVGNAGAHGGDMAGNLIMAEILHPEGHGAAMTAASQIWPQEKLGFSYRSSAIKRRQPPSIDGIVQSQPWAVVLAAVLRLERSSAEAVKARSDELLAYRRRKQPPGASMGSMFKNPPGDYAGRLIEAAGLKGVRLGQAEISSLHANFFINRGRATAADIYGLIRLAQATVLEKFGVALELEIELLGEW
jgi:UDP-N-acetylmuramate dehydrogenase